MAYKSPLGKIGPGENAIGPGENAADLPRFERSKSSTGFDYGLDREVHSQSADGGATSVTKTGFDIAKTIADRSKARKSSGGTGRLSQLSQAIDATDNVARKARLQGQKDRTSARQENRAVRVEARNKKKLEKTIKRQAKKNDSALPFMGGLAASMGAVRNVRAGLSQIGANVSGGNISDAVTGGVDPMAPIAPMASDGSDLFKGKTFQITPANMMGQAKPLFPQATSNAAAMMYDSQVERQMSMPSSGINNNPIEANAFIKAKIDAEKAGDSSFTVDGKQYQVK